MLELYRLAGDCPAGDGAPKFGTCGWGNNGAEFELDPGLEWYELVGRDDGGAV